MSRPDPTTRTHRVLASPRRAALLELLQSASRPVAVSEAAAAVGLHANTTRSHLDRLVEVGLAERLTESRDRPGRPKTLYRATAKQDEPAIDSDPYQQLAGLLAKSLAATADPAQSAIVAGQRWAQELDSRSPAVDGRGDTFVLDLERLIDDLGFAPQVDHSNAQISLHRCPFAAVARENRTVVCGVHLGMLRQTMERMGRSADDVDLEPFVNEEPLRCLIYLTMNGRTRQDD